MQLRSLLSIVKYLVICAALVSLQGCLSSMTSSSTDLDVPPIANSLSNHPDIELPSDLELDSTKSLAINTDSFKGGLYHYSGRLEFRSLKEFIKRSMTNKNWKLVGEAAYKQTMLAFTKPNKTCMVILYEGFGGTYGKTHVQLYVTTDLTAAKGLNPFGEPAN
jgi:hypothetical protein